MKKKIFIIILTIIAILKFEQVKAEEMDINNLIKELKESTTLKDMERNNHKIEITANNKELEIKDEYNNDDIRTIFYIKDNYIEFTSSEDKELLTNKAIWIEEINNIILKYNNYGEDVINNFDISKYKFSLNGIEGVRNNYLKDGKELHYYFYYKANLDKIDLDKKEENIELIEPEEKDDVLTTGMEAKTENDISTNNKKKKGSYTLFIEIFCIVIAVIMLIISSATKG